MTVLQFISEVFTLMEVGENVSISEKMTRLTPGRRLSHSEILLSGAISGAMAKTVIAPLDRLKILFQTDPTRRFTMTGVMDMAIYIRANMGYLSFWRGHTATLVRVIPYSATNFFVFDRTRTALEPVIGSHVHPIVLKFVSGAFSGSVAVCATYPLETLRARLAVDIDGTRYPTGYTQAVSLIVKSDGFMSLYSGLRPTLVGIVPYAGTSFAVYETLRTDNMSFQSRFAVGALAGVLAQAITYPLDVVRRRMQVHPNEYAGIWSSLRRVAIEEGLIGGLYKGLSMNLIKGPLAVAISLNANDHIKDFFLNAIYMLRIACLLQHSRKKTNRMIRSGECFLRVHNYPLAYKVVYKRAVPQEEMWQEKFVRKEEAKRKYGVLKSANNPSWYTHS